MIAYLQNILDFVGLHPLWAIVAAFLVSLCEALPIIGLVAPSTVVLVGVGGLIGLGKVSFWPVFIATVLGACLADAASYWTGRLYKDRLAAIWPFSRYRGLLATGQRYFDRHGGKSIFIARFVPGIKPFVTSIAGMMGMGALRFTILNLLSAIAWAAAHILPGVTAGLALTGLNAISKRLAIFLGILLVGTILAMWLAKVIVRFGLRRLTRVQMALISWAEGRNDRIGRIIERLAAPQHSDFRLLVVLNMILISAIISFAALLEDVMTKDAVVRFDQSFGHFLQSLRTTWTDAAMVAVTLLGDWPVISALCIAGCTMLLVYGQFRFAAGLVVALASAQLFVEGMKRLVEAQRPINIYSGVDAFSFPSGHATMTATFYGVLGWIAFHGAGATLARATAGLCVTMITAIGFSRIYLGAHWPSDVAAGLLFGAGVTAAFGLVFRSYELPRRATIGLITACAATLLIVGGWRIESQYDNALALYAPQAPLALALSQTWRSGGWKELPVRRIDLEGETEEPLLLQWRGSPGALQDELSKHGWLVEPAWSLTTLNGFLQADTGPAALPVVTVFNDGRRQAIAMIRPGNEGRFILRAWRQEVNEQGAPAVEIFVGSIVYERIEHPLNQLSIPTRAETPTCNGDDLLGGSTNSLRVGENLRGPEWACGGQILLAW